MRFEERELPPYAEPVSPADLKEGCVYFSVNYVDEQMFLPTVETLVFIGRDLEPGDSGQVYFQDISSYERGIRYHLVTENDYARFSSGAETELNHLFEYERALEELMRCLLRRGAAE